MALRVLALDLSSTVGWTEGALGERPLYGSFRLKGDTRGARYAALADWLKSRLEAPYAPNEIAIEAPLAASGQGNTNTARLLIGLAEMVEYVTFRFDVHMSEGHLQKIRKQVLGRGNFPRGTSKDAVMAWCRAEGWDVPDHHAADSLILWKAVEQLRMPRLASAA